jgi:hypothetical protein
MLIPQFSLRWMLAVITLLAVVFLVVSRAVQGSAWAVGVSAAVLMLAVVMLVHGGLFFLIWLVSLMNARRQRSAAAMAVARAAVAATPFKTEAAGQDYQPPARQ